MTCTTFRRSTDLGGLDFSLAIYFGGKKSSMGNGLVPSFQIFKIYKTVSKTLVIRQAALRKERAAARKL